MFFYVFIALFFCPNLAQAYVDPGSGSFFLQMLIAGSMGLIFHFRRFFIRIFGGKKNVVETEKLPDDK